MMYICVVGFVPTEREGARDPRLKPVNRTREAWPDLARGTAVISMVFAHTAPVGGVLGIVEFLTAPLFAMLVTISLVLSWEQRSVSARRWIAIQWLRGALLFGLGEVLQTVYSQILVVLQSLGVLTVVAALLIPLLAHRPRISLGLGIAGAFVSPLVMEYARSLPTTSPLASRTLDLLAAGRSYRLASFLAIGLVGIALLHLIRRLRPTPRPLVATATTVTVLAMALLAFGRLGPGLKPYSGTTLEIIFVQLLCAATVLWCVVLTTPSGVPLLPALLDPLIATGRLALTAYALQLVVLRILTDAFLGGGHDDHWWVLIATCAAVVVFCMLWQGTGLPGPFEALIRIPARVLGGRSRARVRPRRSAEQGMTNAQT